MFLVRKEKQEGKCRIEYVAMDDFWRKEEKLEWLRTNPFQKIEFNHVIPDKNHNWLNIAKNNWEELLPLCDKDVKLGRKKVGAVFELFTLGTVSNRDEWVYDFDKITLGRKINYFVNQYNEDLKTHRNTKGEISEVSTIKYTRDLKKRFTKATKLEVVESEYRECLYKVFTKKHFYYDVALNEMRYQTPLLFPKTNSQNQLIAANVGNKPFNILASKCLVDLHFNGDSQCLPLYRYDSTGNRIDNITDWGLDQFRGHYNNNKIKKEDIFHYVYAVLHNPAYRKKYELNLKREFPRIPFYEDFWRWAGWGKELMALHINYETVEPYTLKVITSDTKSEHKQIIKDMPKDIIDVCEPQAMYGHQPKIKVKLRADKERGIIEIDELTTMTGIPKEAWEYKLGNRSALEWILDQYKEKKPSDPTIAEKFNTYRFSHYKDKVIDLLKRVCEVSVETMKIVREMDGE